MYTIVIVQPDGRVADLPQDIKAKVERVAPHARVSVLGANVERPIEAALKAHAQTSYAILVLTPDDRIVLSDNGAPRASPMQATMLALGFFLGVVGPERICVLWAPGAEIPAVLHGLRLLEIDPGGEWVLGLLDALRDAEIA